jgi:putative aminopeptidase FrvX
VTTLKIKNNAITGAKVKADALTGLDLKEATLGKVPSATTADKAATATAADRASSAALADRATVASSVERAKVNTVTATNPNATLSSATATCDAGLKAVSAGVQVQDPANQFVVDLFPSGVDNWTARVANSTTGGTFTVYVICSSVNLVTF